VFGKRCCLVGYSGQESWADIIFLVRLFGGCKEEYAKDYILWELKIARGIVRGGREESFPNRTFILGFKFIDVSHLVGSRHMRSGACTTEME
jgi:hypothetical protein